MATSWHRIDQAPDEGRVRTAVIDGRSVALTRCGGRLGALDNHCPHQGGPLGEGSIENGLAALPVARLRLRPAHRPPAGRVHRRAGRPSRSRSAPTASTSQLPDADAAPAHACPTCWSRRWSRGASTPCSAWSGTPTSGFADALRRAEERGELRYVGIRHEGAAAFAASRLRQADRPPGGLLRDRRPGLDQPAHRAVRRQARRRAGAGHLRAGAVEGARPRRVPGPRPRPRSSATSPSPRRPCTPARDHAELAALAVKHAVDGRGVAHLVLPDEVQVQPVRRAGRRPPDGRLRRPRPLRPAADAWPRAADLVARRPPAGDRRRPRRPRRRADVIARWPSSSARRCSPRSRPRACVPDTHPLGAGVLGRSGTPVASWLMNESDLLLVVGASFANHTGIAPYKPIVQVDDDPDGDRPVPRRSTVGRARRRRASPLRRARRAAGRRRRRGRPAARRRRPVGDLAGREGPPGRRRPRPRRRLGRRVRRAVRAPARPTR